MIIPACAQDGSTNNAFGDLLQFQDGSFVHGALKEINPSRGVVWQHPDAKSPFTFRPANISSIRFLESEAVAARNQALCWFQFRNGDNLYGRLVSADAETVRLEALIGGALQTARSNLASVAVYERGYNLIYDGPAGPEGWKMERQGKGWFYKDGAFVSDGAGLLSRKFPQLTNSSSIAFDLSWNGQFSFVLSLFSDRAEQFDYSSSAYLFNFSQGYINLQRIQAGAGSSVLGQIQAPGMIRSSRTRFEIRSNREEGVITLLADGAVLQRFKDNRGFVANGTSVIFFSQLEGPQLKISNLRIAGWDGRVEPESASPEASKEDLVCLMNRDKVSGRVEGVREGRVTITSAGNRFEIPLQRVTDIQFAAAEAPTSTSQPWLVRAQVRGGGAIAMNLQKLDALDVAGLSPNFGPVSFKSRSIRLLEFNSPGRPAEAKSGEMDFNEFRNLDE